MFKIITDTSANLPTELISKNDIGIIPFNFYVDGKPFTCLNTEEFDGHSFYDAMRNGAEVTTSQISPGQYADYMKPILENGENILFIGMSSGISGSFHSAELAAKELESSYPDRKIRLVDTLGASLGEGLLVLKALKDKMLGEPLEKIYLKLLDLRNRLCNIFTVNDLNYLRKGGRLSNLAFICATILNIKPLLKGNENGKIVAFSKVRGRRKSIEELAERYEEYVEEPENQTVGIAHADCPEDAEKLISLLNRRKPPKEILSVCYEPVTGSHVGPGTLALFFEAKKGCRSM